MVLDIQRQESAQNAVYCKTGCGREIPVTLCHIGTRAGGDRETGRRGTGAWRPREIPVTQGLRKEGEVAGGSALFPKGPTVVNSVPTLGGQPLASVLSRTVYHLTQWRGWFVSSFHTALMSFIQTVSSQVVCITQAILRSQEKSFCYFKVNSLGGFSSKCFEGRRLLIHSRDDWQAHNNAQILFPKKRRRKPNRKEVRRRRTKCHAGLPV